MQFYEKLLKSNYINNIIKLLTGTFAAQLIVILFSPIFTRLYTPAEIGFYSSILAYTAFIAPLINGRYEFLIVSAKTDLEAKQFAYLSFIICTFFTLIISIALFSLKLLKVEFLSDVYFIYILLIIVIIYSNGLTNIFTQYNNRLKQYKLIAQVTVNRSLAQVVLQFIFGLFKLGSLGLSLSIVVGIFVGLKKQINISIGSFRGLFNVSKTNILNLFKINIRQLWVSLPAAVLNTSANNLLLPIITFKYGLVISGFYYISSRILAMPVQVFGSTLGKVYYEQACRENEKYGRCSKSFLKTILLALIFMLPICLIAYFYSEKIVSLVFGEGWAETAQIIVILVPYYFIRAITLSIIMTPYVFKLQFFDLINQFLLLSNLIISLGISYYYELNFLQFFKVFNFFGCISYLIVLVLCWFLASQKFKRKSF